MKKGLEALFFFLFFTLLRELRYLREVLYNVIIPAAAVGFKAVGAILYAALDVAEIPAAFVAERVKRAVTEQAVEKVRIGPLVAGEVLAIGILIIAAGILFLLVELFGDIPGDHCIIRAFGFARRILPS